GATVRLVAPLLAGKHDDPGVVCVDEARRWAVALVGGHGGGANALAERVAATLGSTAVVTTASDAAGALALDDFGADVGLRREPGGDVAGVGVAVLSGQPVELRTDEVWPLPPLPANVRPGPPAAAVEDRPPAASVGRGWPLIAVTDRASDPIAGSDRVTIQPSVLYGERTDPGVSRAGPTVVYRPPSLVVGIGASRGAPAQEIDDLVDAALAAADLSPLSVRHVATADIKRDEPGIIAVSRRRGLPLVTYPAAALAAVEVPNPSEVVRAAVGTPSVAEAAALLGPDGHPAPGAHLVVAKTVGAHATVAVARHRPRGRLALVGLGPGARDLLTPRAAAELARASIVIGLDQYLVAVRDLLRPGTTILPSGLGDEEARAHSAVDHARAGHAVALVGSGDAGVYAMASPALEYADGSFDVVGVPGITAALASAALLGAPLGHDHALISLSDLHTPWEAIERRVRAVADADLVVAFYNPRSRTRTWQLPRSLELLGEQRKADCPVGIVRDAFRPAQQVTITSLGSLDEETLASLVTMTTTVVVGNSHTRVVAGRMVTPRGYRWA
ncbi:MAG: precorrin-3B C(17)-methyltransferase, partial [Frankia sp.]